MFVVATLIDAVDIVPIAVVLARALEPIAEPVVRNPLLNLAVIFAQAYFKVVDGVTLVDAPRMAESFDFHHDGCFSALQPLGNRPRRNLDE